MSGINRKLIIIGKWSINSRFMNYTRHSRHDEQVKLSYIEKLLWSFICCLFICTFVKACMRCTTLEVSGYIILDTHCEELIGGHQSPFHTLFNVWSPITDHRSLIDDQSLCLAFILNFLSSDASFDGLCVCQRISTMYPESLLSKHDSPFLHTDRTVRTDGVIVQQ